jgi:hypothetical protein
MERGVCRFGVVGVGVCVWCVGRKVVYVWMCLGVPPPTSAFDSGDSQP